MPAQTQAGNGTASKRDRSYPPLPEPLPAPVVDNHTHLDSHFGPEQLSVAEHIERAAAVGVQEILTVGCDLESARWTAQVVTEHPQVLGAVAIHPNDAPRMAAAGTYRDGLAEIAELARGERIRAIGESGLDYYRTPPEGRELQISAFREHIALAKELGLALQIHDRDAHRDVIETLLADGAPERTVFHCFSGDAEMARRCTGAGWYLSFAGTITFSANEELRRAVAAIPLSHLLVETDAPYLTPTPYRGRPNAPYVMTLTTRAIAEIRGLDLAETCAQITDTTHRVYGLWQ